ncbi:MAG: hypothetical protein KAT70_05200 [Thermoplasmata archaeon]|nr:hypothetical protein [Thermoplasmata archaeon]
MTDTDVVVAHVEKGHTMARAGPLVAILITLWVFMLHVSPSFFHTFPFGLGLDTWRVIATVVLGLVLLMEARVVFGSAKPEKQSKKAEKEEGAGEKVTVDYPPKITGVIYADTYMPIDGLTELKMRTMMARACPLCENEEECWEKAGKSISKEDFMANMECKEGLRELGASL